MRKRLIAFGILLLFFIGYVIWRMRPLDIPSFIGSEQDLKLDLLPQIPKEENLGYTFQSSGAMEIYSFLNPFYQNNSFRREENTYYLSDFRRIKALKLHDNKMWYGDPKVEQVEKDIALGTIYDISFEDYFSGVKMGELIQKANEKGTLSGLITAIHTQEWVADTFNFFAGANQGEMKAQYIVDFMEQIAFYYYQKGDFDQGKNYLESVLLLYSKMNKYNSELITSFCLSRVNRFLGDMIYFTEQGIVPRDHIQYLLRLTTLWENYPTDAIAYHQHTVKWNYHFWLEEFEALESLTGMIDLKYPFRDKKETLSVLKAYSVRLLKNPSVKDNERNAWIEEKDRRCVWQQQYGDSIELNQDNLYLRYFVEHIRKPFKPYLWRKNLFGVSMLCDVGGFIGDKSRMIEQFQQKQSQLKDFVEQGN